jgi:predicted extracellular nuclease
VLIGNHWPSRIGGTFDSEPYRIMAAENLAYFHQRIVETNDKNVSVIAMGDFNDEPFNRSIMDYAISTNNSAQLKRARKPKFYNLMWPLLAKGIGTYYYGGTSSMLDQMMVSKGFLFRNSRLAIKQNSIKVEKIPDMASRGKPCRFGRPSKKKSYNENGFSDHFPISVIIEFD